MKVKVVPSQKAYKINKTKQAKNLVLHNYSASAMTGAQTLDSRPQAPSALPASYSILNQDSKHIRLPLIYIKEQLSSTYFAKDPALHADIYDAA